MALDCLAGMSLSELQVLLFCREPYSGLLLAAELTASAESLGCFCFQCTK